MDVQNVNLQTALHLAVERQHTQIVRVCIQTHCDVIPTLWRFWLHFVFITAYWFNILVLFNNYFLLLWCGRLSSISWWMYAGYRRPLQSADNWTCLVKRSRNRFGDCCFANAVEQSVWTALATGCRKHICLVSRASTPCVCTLRAPTRNLTYLISYVISYLLRLSSLHCFVISVTVNSVVPSE